MTSRLKRKAPGSLPAFEPPQPTPATKLIENAFRDLEKIVAQNDRKAFSSTTLEDVQNAARDIEKQLEAKDSQCRMRRLEPLFSSLKHYSGPLEVLCNGTPYLPWIWAPIKLILQISSEFHDLFRLVIGAYSEIGKTLPRFDRLSDAFRSDSNFQQVLAIFYVDIVRFHKEAYKLVKRSGWNIFFSSTWGILQRRIKGIIDDLERHAKLVELEACVNDIVEAEKHRKQAKEWREQDLERIAREDEHRAIARFQAVQKWLEHQDSDQSDILDSISSQCHEGTTSWMLQNPEFASWLRNGSEKRFLVLAGKPGSGKSVLMSQLTKVAATLPECLVFYHFCNHRSPMSQQYGHILRSIAAQLLRNNDDLIAYVYDEYFLGSNRKEASPFMLERLIPCLLAAISNDPSKTVHVKILLDGIDECEDSRQQNLLAWLQSLTSNSDKTVCKVLVSGRDTPRITKFMKSKPFVSLSREHLAVKASIEKYIIHRLEDMRTNALNSSISKEDIDYVEKLVVDRSDGMFLWVRLVCDVLVSDWLYNAEEMRTVVETMPKELNAFYLQILEQMSRRSDMALQKMRFIMGWIAYHRRPLKSFELQSVVALHHNLEKPPSAEVFEELCKPLVELGPSGSLVFVHSSVQKFLTSKESGPFIEKENTHLFQTRSCIQVLLLGLDLLDSDIHSSQQAAQIIRGRHGFHVYANEFWIDHLLWFAESQAACERVMVTSLWNLVDTLCSRISSSTQSIPHEGDGLSLDQRLSLLTHQTNIHQAVLGQILLRRQVKSEEFELDSSSRLAPQFRLIRSLQAYQHRLRVLFDVQSVEGILPDELDSFKKVFRASAFTCQYSGCPRATLGFENDTRRQEHERVHSQTLRCTEPDCQYGLPFTSTRALKTHMSKSHAIGAVKTMTLRFRKQVQEPPSSNPFAAISDNLQAKDIVEFRYRAMAAIKNPHVTGSDVQKLIEEGQEFDDDIPEMKSLTTQVQAVHWVKENLTSSDKPPKQRESWEDSISGVLAIDNGDPLIFKMLFDQVLNVPQSRETRLAIFVILKTKERGMDVFTKGMIERTMDPNQRKRPTYKEIQKMMELIGDSSMIKITRHTRELERRLKRHEDWMRRGKKLFGKANAALHILLQHMHYVEDRNRFCFDLKDQPRWPVEPPSREPSPSSPDLDVFCICRKTVSGMMIECELCHEWYHGRCLKIARGKVKEDDKYTCPICDYRVKIPRDAARPKLEALQAWQDEIPNLPFRPDEEEVLSKIIDTAQEFRSAIVYLMDPLMSTRDNLLAQRFYLRKIEGADVLLAPETNFFRQELHKWAPVAPEPPKLIDVSSQPRKPRPTKQQKWMHALGITNPDDLPDHFKSKRLKAGKPPDGSNVGSSRSYTPPNEPSTDALGLSSHGSEFFPSRFRRPWDSRPQYLSK